MAKAIEMTIGIPDVSLWIEYQESNNRILNVQWTIPQPGIAIRARVWDSGVLVIDRTEGQGSGSMNIPGNYRMVEVTDSSGTYMDLPPNITYGFNMQLFAP